MARSDYDLLITKLDAFIRKYYKDQLLRGLLYSVGLVVAVFIVVALMEHVGRFGTTARTALFWATLAAMAVVLVRFVARPLIKLFRLGPVIGHAEAARIVGTHFHEVRDKLLNTLQLREMAASDPARRDLIEAAIAQRSRELGPVPFVNAIDLRRNTRYLRYAAPPVALLLVLLLAAPSLITGPTQRLIRHGSEFVPEAPFRFVVLNDSLAVPEQQDFELVVELRGDVVPQQVDIDMEGHRAPLVKRDARRFVHRFRNVQHDTPFRLTAEGTTSEAHLLRALPRPMLLDIHLDLEFPAYLGRPAERVGNPGDLLVPAGTRVKWNIHARRAERLDFDLNDSTRTLPMEARKPEGAMFTTAHRFLRGGTYSMTPRLGELPAEPALVHRVEVVPDLHPTIQVETRTDSTAMKRLFYRGVIGDDHGLRKLVFHYRFATGGDSLPPELRSGSKDLRIDPASTRQEFFHSWDINELPLDPGDRIEHWFEVWDNDGVSGSKSTRSRVEVFAAPTARELAQQQDRDNELIKADLQQNIQEAQDLQRELEKLRRELLEKKEAGWQDRQNLENVMQRQQQLQQRIEQNNERLRQSHLQQQEFRTVDERLMDKQRQVQELFENVLSEEMKELYRQMQEMLEQLDKDQLQDQMKEMQLGQEDIEKELDRALEIFKQMEVEQMAMDITEQLREMAREQEELGQESEAGETPNEELQQRQDSLNKAFDELRKDLDKLHEKNQELEQPMDVPDTDPQEQEIQKDQQKSSEELDNGQPRKAGPNQKSAGEKMDQLAHQIESAMQAGADEQQGEDMEALRQLLENLIHLSFDQEALMGEVTTTSTRDPRFVEHGRKQRKLRDDAKVVEDSLFALSKRVPQLQSVVNREMNAVNDNMDQAVTHMGEARANERHKAQAADRQQHAMTGLNNLALLLDEALQQMMGEGKGGNCDKPGSGQGSKPGMGKMKGQQQALQKQLEEMRKAMEKGARPGEKNPGGMGAGMSQELARMAAQQAAIRKEMQRLAQELNKDGSGAGNELSKLAEQMEKQEKDIVNKDITRETMLRQEEIMTR
ncbi:MAG: hypothetical protein RBT71_08930, partial [Flavobacteriales bacterium]|nr:hypothetical protein [Flavobacteriales bacterium]